MANFDIFLNEKEFESFAQFAVAAENCYSTDTTACVDNCGRALDAAVRWMYSVDSDLKFSDNDALITLVYNDSFRTLIGDDLWRRINYIRQIAKTVSRKRKRFSSDQAALCLENLFDFLDFIAFCYGTSYEEKEFVGRPATNLGLNDEGFYRTRVLVTSTRAKATNNITQIIIFDNLGSLRV